MASLTPRIDALEGRCNYIINGAFDYWQRHVVGNGPTPTVTTTSNGVFLADRFRNLRTGSGTQIMSRETDVPTAAESGFKSNYSFKYTQSVAASVGAQSALLYKIEGHDYANLHNRMVRLAFWVKASIAGIYTICFSNNATDRMKVIEYTITTANTWQKIQLDFTTDSIDGNWAFDSSAGAIIFWNIGNHSTPATPNVWQSTSIVSANQTQLHLTLNATFFMAQVSLTPIDSPSAASTPFQRAGGTIGGELTLCQRYYEKSYNVNTSLQTTGADGHTQHVDLADSTSSTAGIRVHFKTTKRQDIVAISFFNRTTGTSGSWESNRSNAGTLTFDGNVSVASSGSTESSFGVNASGSIALVVGDPVRLVGHWAVDCEM